MRTLPLSSLRRGENPVRGVWVWMAGSVTEEELARRPRPGRPAPGKAGTGSRPCVRRNEKQLEHHAARGAHDCFSQDAPAAPHGLRSVAGDATVPEGRRSPG